MRILGMTPPELVVMLGTCLIPILVLYWTVRFAVKHGIEEAFDKLKKDGKI